MSWSLFVSMHLFLTTFPRGRLPTSLLNYLPEFSDYIMISCILKHASVWTSTLSRIPYYCNLFFHWLIFTKPLKFRPDINIHLEFLLTSLHLSSVALPPLQSCSSLLISVLEFITCNDNNLFTCQSIYHYTWIPWDTESYFCIPSV